MWGRDGATDTVSDRPPTSCQPARLCTATENTGYRRRLRSPTYSRAGQRRSISSPRARPSPSPTTSPFTDDYGAANDTSTSRVIVITVTGTNDKPSIVAGSTTDTASITELAGQTGSTTLDPVAGTIAFADVDLSDNHTVSQATPTFSWSGGTLHAAQITALTSAGTLSLTETDNTGFGTGSVAWNYQAQDKTFDFVGTNQTLAITYQVTVNDGHGGTVNDNVVVTVTGTDDAPVVTDTAGSTTWKAGAPVKIDSGATVTDIDNATLASATVKITSGLASAEDVLAFSNINSATFGNIAASYNANAGTLTLTSAGASATLAQWQAALDAVTYNNSSQNPTGTSRTISFTVNDSQLDSAVSTKTVTLVTPPVVDLNGVADGTNNTIIHPHNDVTPILIASAATITDQAATTLQSMTITLTSPVDNSEGAGGPNAKEVLSLSAAAQQIVTNDRLTMTLTVNGRTPETLMIQGAASTADYQTILEGVQYTDAKTGGQNTAIRTVQVVVNDGSLNSNIATVTINVAAPAGAAGHPINLALANPSGAADTPITLLFSGLPTGWSLNEGTNLGDGTWALATNDVSALMVTTSADYTGAVLLHATETWINSDGVSVSAIIGDNVEAYAPGSPIFAWSGSDTLTGSGANDVFVFAGPISNDDVYNFNAASDKIDLIGFDGVRSFADLHIADNPVGGAIIDLGNGQTITLHGVDAASLTGSDFLFDQTPITDNAGSMVIGDGAMLPLSGDINNTGSIDLDSAGNGALLQLTQYGVTLHGDGQIVLSDDEGNVISGTLQGVTLNNVDNTISGAGQLGAGELDLINSGTIVATGSHSLIIDTGAHTIENFGTLESAGSGGLVVNSSVDNSGQILAHGGDITLNGAVSGSGSVVIDGTATVTFGAAAAVNTTLATDAIATLVMRDSIDFSGKISGFDANDHLDLKDMTFGHGVSLAYIADQNSSGGILQVSDGAHTANIALLGQYDAAGFASASDGGAGTLISYDPTHHTA